MILFSFLLYIYYTIPTMDASNSKENLKHFRIFSIIFLERRRNICIISGAFILNFKFKVLCFQGQVTLKC